MSVSAQFRYGLRLGGVFETPTPTHLWDGGSGFAGGVTCEWQSSSSGIAVGASLNYERRTMNYAGDALTLIGYEPPQDAGGDFLALPIDVKYKFMLPALKELAGPYVLTGPDIALRLSKGAVVRPMLDGILAWGLTLSTIFRCRAAIVSASTSSIMTVCATRADG